MAIGRKTGGGSRAGVPNKVTADTRAFFAGFAERNFSKLDGLIDETAEKDPAKAADLILRAAEYHVPKLGRVEHLGEGGGPLQVQIVRFTDPPAK